MSPESISDFLSKLKMQIYLTGIYQSPQWICPDPETNWTDPPLPWGPFDLTFPLEEGAMIEGVLSFIIHPPKCFFPVSLRSKLPGTIGCSSQCIEHKQKQYEGNTFNVEVPNPTGSPYDEVWPVKSVKLNSGYQFGGLTFWGADPNEGIIVSYKNPVVGIDCVKCQSAVDFREQVHRRVLQDKSLLDNLMLLHR